MRGRCADVCTAVRLVLGSTRQTLLAHLLLALVPEAQIGLAPADGLLEPLAD